jgi:hypothetical protein
LSPNFTFSSFGKTNGKNELKNKQALPGYWFDLLEYRYESSEKL